MRPIPPLSSPGGGFYSGDVLWMTEGLQSWRSNGPTGTRSFVTSSSTHEGAVGVMMIVGEFPVPVGGWGVGLVRMGAN